MDAILFVAAGLSSLEPIGDGVSVRDTQCWVCVYFFLCVRVSVRMEVCMAAWVVFGRREKGHSMWV